MKPLELWIALAILVTASVATQAEDDLFGAGSDEPGGLVSQTTAPDRSLADDLLSNDAGLVFSGDFAFLMRSRWDDISQNQTNSAAVEGTLNLEARPDPESRMLAKLDYQLDAAGSIDLSVREWFGDISINDRLFVRAGRQTLSWGVGYFFSPVDVVNTSEIDPLDPDAQRTGVMSARAHLPMGTSNYYAYILPGSGEAGSDLALKGEWLLGSAEWTLGGVLQAEGADTLATTLSQPWGDASLFAELAVTHGETSASFSDQGLGASREDDWLPQATLGSRVSLSDDDDYRISLVGQYFYNGLGYAEPYWQEQPHSWWPAAAQGEVNSRLRGRHYGAASIQWQEILSSDWSSSVIALYSATDDSWRLQPQISYDWLERFEVTLKSRHDLGDSGSVYSMEGDRNEFIVEVSVVDFTF